MIRTRDAVLLASTKLKTRRIRLGILLVTMSILFAGLVFIANVVSGTIGSLQSFGKEGYGGRFLVQAHPITYQPFDNSTLLEEVKPLQNQLVAQKTALAKKLGVVYDPKTDFNLYYMNQQVGPNASDVQPNLIPSTLTFAALDKQNAAIPGVSFNSFVARAKRAGAIGTYRSALSGGFAKLSHADGGALSVILNGKEDYSGANVSASQSVTIPSTTGISSIQALGWGQISDAMLKPFLLDGQTTAVGNDGSVPIIAPFSAAEQILGLSKLPATAPTDEKLHRLIQVRGKIAGRTAQLCYRNNASVLLLRQVLQQQEDIAAHKGKADYTPPSLLYNAPQSACAAVTVKSDKRTAEEKKADDNQRAFNSTFNPFTEPVQGVITLRIVGISPDVNTGDASFSASGLLSGILGSNVGSGWFSPTSAITAGSLAARAQNGTITDQPLDQQTYYAEFSSLAAATSFMKQTDCYAAGYDPNPNSQPDKCAKKGKPFSLSPYGNNAGAIADFQQSIWNVLRFVLLGVVVVAVLVMMGTFGKVIADGRRETAVFRSLGASRFALSQIYLMYTLLICAMVSGCALVIGTVGAEVLNYRFSPELSVSAVLTYNAHDVHKQFVVVGFSPLYLAVIVGMIVGSALVSAVIPLVLNMRRNPIRDMRDE